MCELNRALRELCDYMANREDSDGQWVPCEPIGDILAPRDPRENINYGRPFDALRSMIDVFANRYVGTNRVVPPQPIANSARLRDALIQNLIGTIERINTEVPKKLDVDWLKRVQRILGDGKKNLIIELEYDKTKEYIAYIEPKEKNVYTICFNARTANTWVKAYSECILESDMLRAYFIHELRHFWQRAIGIANDRITYVSEERDAYDVQYALESLMKKPRGKDLVTESYHRGDEKRKGFERIDRELKPWERNKEKEDYLWETEYKHCKNYQRHKMAHR
jgi:hypothetical protein